MKLQKHKIIGVLILAFLAIACKKEKTTYSYELIVRNYFTALKVSNLTCELYRVKSDSAHDFVKNISINNDGNYIVTRDVNDDSNYLIIIKATNYVTDTVHFPDVLNKTSDFAATAYLYPAAILKLHLKDEQRLVGHNKMTLITRYYPNFYFQSNTNYLELDPRGLDTTVYMQFVAGIDSIPGYPYNNFLINRIYKDDSLIYSDFPKLPIMAQGDTLEMNMIY